MRNIVGQPVKGADFYNRLSELETIWDRVERGSLLLLAPRRVGKTSLLLRLRDQPSEGWDCSYLDVMSVDSEQRFVARLLAHLYQSSGDRKRWTSALGSELAGLLGRLAKVKAGPVEWELVQAVGDDWQEVGSRALTLELPRPTLLLIDELPVFVQRLLRVKGGAERADLLLSWFRGIRAELADGKSTVRFLLAGSIGLDSVVARAGLSSTINDLRPFRLGPLAVDDADGLLTTLGTVEGVELADAVRERALERISWAIPFHLQLLFAKLREMHRLRHLTLQPEHVDEAYDELLGPADRMHFAHWLERLDLEAWTTEERALIEAILRGAALDSRGVLDETVEQLRREHAPAVAERELLHSLEHDGYLTPESNDEGRRWRFASALLRDWWLRWRV